MKTKGSAPQGYLVDNSVLQKLGRSNELLYTFLEISTVFPIYTCPPQVLEYCWSARNPAEYQELREDMEMLAAAKLAPTQKLVLDIQEALWGGGFLRGVGNADVLVVAYAIQNQLVLLHNDHDFKKIAKVLGPEKFQQEFIPENGGG